MYKLITIVLGIYIFYYVLQAYLNMKKLKKNMDEAPKKLLISYDKQIYDLQSQLAEVSKTVTQYQTFPPSFSVNRGLKKAKKHQTKLKQQIKQKEFARNNYLKLLRSYQNGEIDKVALKKWVNEKQGK